MMTKLLRWQIQELAEQNRRLTAQMEASDASAAEVAQQMAPLHRRWSVYVTDSFKLQGELVALRRASQVLSLYDLSTLMWGSKLSCQQEFQTGSRTYKAITISALFSRCDIASICCCKSSCVQGMGCLNAKPARSVQLTAGTALSHSLLHGKLLFCMT